mmetsp:Transcript_61663/g.130143  ORF Transcript_61663/g.130143 Transcript_61663/m.130143 type:complete len:238 (+) Transcript_61663:1120-1833(+)
MPACDPSDTTWFRLILSRPGSKEIVVVARVVVVDAGEIGAGGRGCWREPGAKKGACLAPGGIAFVGGFCLTGGRGAPMVFPGTCPTMAEPKFFEGGEPTGRPTAALGRAGYGCAGQGFGVVGACAGTAADFGGGGGAGAGVGVGTGGRPQASRRHSSETWSEGAQSPASEWPFTMIFPASKAARTTLAFALDSNLTMASVGAIRHPFAAAKGLSNAMRASLSAASSYGKPLMCRVRR